MLHQFHVLEGRLCNTKSGSEVNDNNRARDTSLDYVDILNDITTTLRDKVHLSTAELSHYLVDEMVNSLHFFPQEKLWGI